MSIVTCPYRGPSIAQRDSWQVCNHPEVRGPCTLAVGDRAGIRSCRGCRFWRDQADVAAAKLAPLAPLDPQQFEPPPPPAKPKPAALSPKTPAIADRCIRLGEPTGQHVDCADGCLAKLKVFACDKHGCCTLAKAGHGIAAACSSPSKGRCPDYVQLTPDSPIDFCKELLASPPRDWAPAWWGFPNIAEAFRQLLREQQPPAPPQTWPMDRGIVICAGGWRFFPSLYVTIRIIRETGCTLPIQVWYLGDKGEFDERMFTILRDYDVGWVCGNSFARDHNIPIRTLAGWELKPLAALHCPFREVLSLDADSYPAYNPQQFLAHREYERVGAAFWPDLGHVKNGKLEPGQWERFGLANHDEPGWESGQFVVDKARHWDPLWLTAWMNQHSDYVYHHLYGDKDTFHIAWRLLGHEACIPTPVPGWVNAAFVQKDFAGQPLFIHRTRDKFRLRGELDGAAIPQAFATGQHQELNKFIAELPHERFAHGCLRECDELLRPEKFFQFADEVTRKGWDDVYSGNEYRLPIKAPPGSVAVDIGANVGAFTRLAIRRGVSHVLAVEPQAAIAETLRYNTRDVAPSVTVVEKAAWSGGDVVAVGAVAGNACIASVFQPKDPQNVPTIALDDLILLACARSDDARLWWLKLDCEGAEYNLLEHSRRLNCVDNIAGELHEQQGSVAEFYGRLIAAGFGVWEFANGPGTRSFWATRGDIAAAVSFAADLERWPCAP